MYGPFTHHRALRNSKTYGQNLHPNKSVSVENTTDAAAVRDSKRVGKPINGVLLDLIEESIKANLEPLSEQISMLTQLLNQRIHKSWARNSPTAGPRTQQTQSGYSPSNEPVTSRALPGSAIGSTGFLPDNGP